MRILLIGPPGSGKGTQSYFIMKRYNIPSISVGDMLRNIMNDQSILSKRVKNTISSGHLVSDEIVINIVKNRLERDDCNQGFLLDGFPRTITQAYIMKQIDVVVDIVLVFVMSEKSIIERISQRYIHVPSGRIYHPKFNPPKNEGYDDITGELLVCREDDNLDVIHTRLMTYYCHTLPVINFYYRESVINHHLRYFSINSDRNVSTIRSELSKLLNLVQCQKYQKH